MKDNRKATFAAVAALTILAGGASGNEALCWKTAPDSGEWSTTAANWEGDRVWSPGATAWFGESTVKALTVNEKITTTNMVFSAGGYTVSGAGALVTPKHSKSCASTAEGSGSGAMAVSVGAGAAVTIAVPVTNYYGCSFGKWGAGDLTLAGGGYCFTFHVGGGGTLALSNGTFTTAKFFDDSRNSRVHFDGATLCPGNANQILGMPGYAFAQATLGKGGLTFGTCPSIAAIATEQLTQNLASAPELAADETDGGLALDAAYTLLIDSPASTFRGGVDIRKGKVLLASAGGLGYGPVTADGAFRARASMSLTNEFRFGAGTVGVTGAVDRLELSNIAFTDANASKTVRLASDAEGGTVRIASGDEPTPVGSFALSGGVTLLADGDTFAAADSAGGAFVSGTGTFRVGNGGVTFDTAGRDIAVNVPMTFDAAYVLTNRTVAAPSAGDFESGGGWSFTKGKVGAGDNSVQTNGSAFAISGSIRYDTTNGTHFAVVRSGSGSSVYVSFTVPSDGTWTPSFERAYRPGITGGENLEYAVYLDYGKETQVLLRDFAADGRMHGFERLELPSVTLAAGTTYTFTVMAGVSQDTSEYKYDCLLVDAIRFTRETYTDVPVGTLVKRGEGTLGFDGVAFTGPVSVQAGTLAVCDTTFASNVVTVASGATVALHRTFSVDVPNADFETKTSDWSTGYLYGWTAMFAEDCIGSQKNGMTVSPNGPFTTAEGPHTALIRLRSGIKTTICVARAGTYELAFDSAPRWGCGTAGYKIAMTALVDNVEVAYVPGRSADKGEFQRTTARVGLSAGNHVLAFRTDNADGSARQFDGPMMFVDNISLTMTVGDTVNENATWRFASGATLDVGGVGATLSAVTVDGTPVRGGKSALRAAGVTVIGSGRVRCGKPTGTMVVVR